MARRDFIRYAPDWIYWGNLEKVDITDAVWLSLNHEPRRYNVLRGGSHDAETSFIMRILSGSDAESVSFQHFLSEFDSRYRLACAHIEVGGESAALARVKLSEFYAWGKSLPTPLTFPDEFPCSPYVAPASIQTKPAPALIQAELEPTPAPIQAKLTPAHAERQGAQAVNLDADDDGIAPLTEQAATAENKWPWGNYETELLRKLAAAAERFWKLYDQADPTTAPTNQAVIKWLESQGVAGRNAQVMATILRADGLPTGPRK